MLRRYRVFIIFILFLSSVHIAKAQVAATDTVSTIEFDESSLDKITDLKKQFEKQNRTYSVPVRTRTQAQRVNNKKELKMSPEALYWAKYARNASTAFGRYLVLDDTIIVTPLYLPPVFRGNILPKDMQLYDKDIVKTKSPYDFMYKPDSTLYKKFMQREATYELAYEYIERNHPQYFRFSERDLPGETIKTTYLQKPITEEPLIFVHPEVSFDDVEAPAKFIPDRLYWRSAFESVLQFSQNYISPNWHKGGTSNLNIFTKNHLRYDYNKDKVQFTNEMEIKVSFFNAPKDNLRRYKIGDDVFRLHSNIGYQAFNKWYYTFDTEFKTQLFKNYQENSNIKQAAFLAPLSLNMGIGMKYDLEKTYTKRNKNLKLSVNLAPLSYTFMYSTRKDIEMDLGRHGFEKKKNPVEGENPYENILHRIGSTVRTDMTMNFSRNISWQSRLYYFTTYHQTLAEFENTLILAITRHFSTRIYAHIRFDDSVEKTEDFDSYFQVNELLSFGFNYKW